jgi:membrane protease YdiL (CAAX protease family)
MTKKAWIFLALTFLFSWIILPIYFALGGKFNSPFTLVVLLLYMFVPMTMAIVVQKFIYREPLREPLGIWFKPNRWFLYAWFLPPLLAIATLGVSLLLPGIRFSPEMEGMYQRFGSSLTPEQLRQMRDQAAALPIHPFWIGLFSGLIAGVTINAVAAFGEELGWRGLLQKELEPLGFWKSSLLIGVIWGIWHAPIIWQGYNYPEHPQIGVVMMTIFTTLFAPLISYARLKSKSVIAAAIMHGTLNGTAGIALLVVAGGNDLTIGITGLAGLIALALASLILFVLSKV